MVEYKGYKISKCCGLYFFIKGKCSCFNQYIACKTYNECKQLINDKVRLTK